MTKEQVKQFENAVQTADTIWQKLRDLTEVEPLSPMQLLTIVAALQKTVTMALMLEGMTKEQIVAGALKATLLVATHTVVEEYDD